MYSLNKNRKIFDRIGYPALLSLALLALLPLSTAYIDCRISCRRCTENTEHPSVLEVYCAMCEECKNRRREKLVGSNDSKPTLISKPTRKNSVTHDSAGAQEPHVSKTPRGPPDAQPKHGVPDKKYMRDLDVSYEKIHQGKEREQQQHSRRPPQQPQVSQPQPQQQYVQPQLPMAPPPIPMAPPAMAMAPPAMAMAAPPPCLLQGPPVMGICGSPPFCSDTESEEITTRETTTEETTTTTTPTTTTPLTSTKAPTTKPTRRRKPRRHRPMAPPMPMMAPMMAPMMVPMMAPMMPPMMMPCDNRQCIHREHGHHDHDAHKERLQKPLQDSFTDFRFEDEIGVSTKSDFQYMYVGIPKNTLIN